MLLHSFHPYQGFYHHPQYDPQLLLMEEILHYLRLDMVVYPMIYRISYMSGGDRPQPSTETRETKPTGLETPTRLCSVQQATGCALVKEKSTNQGHKTHECLVFFFGIFGCLFFLIGFPKFPMDFCLFIILFCSLLFLFLFLISGLFVVSISMSRSLRQHISYQHFWISTGFN